VNVNIGNALIVSPWALDLKMVATKFTVETVTDAVSSASPRPPVSTPTYGENFEVVRGA
jgi:hypothetical protein